jgi:hypothetical protein
MPAAAPRRELVLAAALVSGVALVLWLHDTGATRERARQADTPPAGDVAPPEASTTSTTEPAAPPANEWRLEVELRGENDEPIGGRVYVTNPSGELLSVLDSGLAATAIHTVNGTVNAIAQGDDLRLAPSFVEGIEPPATGTRTLRMRLAAGATISGRMVDERGDAIDFRDAMRTQVFAEPVGAAWLQPQAHPSWRRMTDASGNWITFPAERDSDASFRIARLPPGLYRLRVDAAYAESLLPPAEPPLVTAGATDVVLVLRRATGIRVRFADQDSGESLEDLTIAWRVRGESGEVMEGGSGSYGEDGLVLHRPPGASFTLDAEAESYERPPPLRVHVGHDGGMQELVVRFRPEAGGMADLELLVRDDVGQPAFPLMIGRSTSARRHSPEDGRYVLRVPAGAQTIELRSPSDQILLFKREWTPSMHDPDDFPPARAYLPQDVEVNLPRGGRVAKEVTVKRAALIWVRHEPGDVFSRIRVLRQGAEVEHALQDLYEDKGLVAAVEPGGYRVEGAAEGAVVGVEVTANAAEVTEVWLRAGAAK